MKITKPKENQLLFEDENLKKFTLKVQNETGLNKSKYNKSYDGVILAYRQPNMDASKQMFFGNTMTICTLISSCLENLLNYGILNEEMLDDMVNAVKQEHKRKRRGE